jgi:hypothetical protein
MLTTFAILTDGLGPAVFDRHIAPLHVAGFGQTAAEYRYPWCAHPRRTRIEIADNRYRRLLPASGHAAVAPPSSDINARRFTRSPRRRGRAALGDFKAERLGGFEIDNKFKFRWLSYRQVGGLSALEDAVDMAGRAPVRVD